MDTNATKRVITLIDMDCFYCQVELRLNPSLAGKPVAVVQYNQWKQGGIIAVNYEARDRGVTRFMRGEEAKKACPELELVSVPCVRGKADLTKYRNAGAEVAAVFSSFSDVVERASVDEAFIDLTNLVEERIMNDRMILEPDLFPSTFVVGFSDSQSNNMDSRIKGMAEWLRHLRGNHSPDNEEYRLAVGAAIVEEIRSEVLRKTGFHCSAGIGHNKILAKLVAGLHKPKCQTIIPHENVPELFENLPVRKVRNLGGKFGQAVCKSLSISTMSELYNFTKDELVEKFNGKNGTWLYDIARGIDHDPVTPRLIPDSIGCSKNFPGPVAIRSKEKLTHWLTDMATEIVERLEKDQQENSRCAKLLTVSFRTDGSVSSRSCPLAAYKTENIVKDSFEILSKFNQSVDGTSWYPPIENLGLSASKFTCQKSSIKTFLKDKPQPNTTEVSEDSEESDLPAKSSFFARMLAQQQKVAEPSQPQEMDPQPTTSLIDDDWYQTCPDCGDRIHLGDYFEHGDFHAALKLDKAINKSLPVKTVLIASKKSLKTKKRKICKPGNQPNITEFFNALPK